MPPKQSKTAAAKGSKTAKSLVPGQDPFTKEMPPPPGVDKPLPPAPIPDEVQSMKAKWTLKLDPQFPIADIDLDESFDAFHIRPTPPWAIKLLTESLAKGWDSAHAVTLCKPRGYERHFCTLFSLILISLSVVPPFGGLSMVVTVLPRARGTCRISRTFLRLFSSLKRRAKSCS